MQKDYLYISRRACLLLLDELFNRGMIRDVKIGWYQLKVFGNSLLLPTGAKLFRDSEGRIGIYGYAFDMSDLKPYRKYSLGGE